MFEFDGFLWISVGTEDEFETKKNGMSFLFLQRTRTCSEISDEKSRVLWVNFCRNYSWWISTWTSFSEREYFISLFLQVIRLVDFMTKALD